MADFKRTIGVTGGAGFIGCNLLKWLVKVHPESRFVCLDALTYAGNPLNLSELEGEANFILEELNLCDFDRLKACQQTYQFDGLYHLAAESHVDRSIVGPAEFVKTNIEGTFNLLELIRTTGGKPIRLLHVSTDEVYGSTLKDKFTESSPYRPNSPYAATKAAADHLVRAYVHTYHLDGLIASCSNNYGPFQHPEKFIPTVIRSAASGQTIPIYGDGENVRDWIHVFDHCIALDLLFEKGVTGQTYNIGSRNERKNIDLAMAICRIVDDLLGGGKREEQIELVADRPGHDRRYALDPSRLESEFGWSSQVSFDTGLRQTVEWYLAHTDWIKDSLARTEQMKGAQQ